MGIDCPALEQLPRMKALWQEAFGDEDAFIDAFFDTAFAPNRSRCITVGAELAAMLYWLDGEYRGQKIAYIYAVATKKAFRGRGLCGRLLADTHERLKWQGYAAAMLRPGEAGLRKLYGKMGYADCCAAQEFTCGAGTAVPLREISSEAYTALRRKFLPEDGLVQEGESIAFLGKLAKLYAGEEVLLAASREGDTLQGIELLGDREKAPGIVAALGCKEGRFRTPGGEPPFAMACPLKEDAEIPGYLGLVFD